MIKCIFLFSWTTINIYFNNILQAKYEEQESALDKQIQGLRDENTKLQHTIKMKADTVVR